MAVKMAAPLHGAHHKLVVEKSSLKNSKSRHETTIRDLSFIYAIDFTFPGLQQNPSDLAQIAANDFFLIQTLPLSCLLKKEFIEAFLKQGQLSMLSYGTKIDQDVCVALVPTGKLLLHLDKDTFQELGLEGRPSQYNSKQTLIKYVVTIDLKAPNFVAGKKRYERVKWCLTDRLDMKFHMMTSWKPNNPKILSQSLKVYFESQGFTCHLGETHKERRAWSEMSCPLVNIDNFEETDDACDVESFYEWLGALSCGVPSELREPSDFVSNFSCPEPNHSVQGCTIARMRGFFTPNEAQAAFDTARTILKKENLPWVSLTAHGFQDSPVLSRLKEHGYLFNGDNMYTFVIFPNQSYWLIQAVASFDECP